MISIHAPRAGCDRWTHQRKQRSILFQSTHPVRGATWNTQNEVREAKFQSTHPVRGATASPRRLAWVHTDFNPRTPCGVRRPCELRHCRQADFNPRTPCGVRLTFAPVGCNIKCISIHAPRAGCDIVVDFNSRRFDISIHAPRAGCDRR